MAKVDTDKMLTPAEAAAEYGIKPDTIRQYCLFYHQGKTPAIENVKFGWSYMISPKAMDDFLKTRRPQGRPAESN